MSARVIIPIELPHRAVPEWIGKTPDAAVPRAVKRKPRGVPVTVEYFRERSILDPQTGCWLWQKAKAWNGYGVVKVPGGGVTRAHRYCYEIANGVSLPSAVDVCHRCDVRNYVNPEHLFQGSRRDNMADCSRKGRIRTPKAAGDACPNSKLTSENARAIRSDPRINRVIAADYGVSQSAIQSIKAGKTWRLA